MESNGSVLECSRQTNCFREACHRWIIYWNYHELLSWEKKAVNIANIRDYKEEKEKKKSFMQGTSNRTQCMHLHDETFNKELKIQIFL